MERLSFRFANRDDAPLILRFIRELAAYENMLDDVVATEELLREWILEKNKAEVLFAMEDGKEIGFALYFHNFSTFLGRAGIYLVYSIVLYDAVAGGAGHVRRIVTEDGAAFQRVLAKAISVVDDCKCDSSCYNCLRNYYNQKIHDNLSRQSASGFLHHWIGTMTPVQEEKVEEVLAFV